LNKEYILQNSGKVTAETAKSFAKNNLEKYSPIQNKDYISDFDKELKKLSSNKNNYA